MIKRPRPLLPVVLGVLALMGCARTPPAQYYLLEAPLAATTPGPRTGPVVGLGPIELPGYLDRPQIVTRAGDNQLQLSGQHRWAEPFAESFSRTLAMQLAAALPEARVLSHPWKTGSPPPVRIALAVDRMDRGADGTLVLLARWTVSRDDAPSTPAAQQVTRITVPNVRDGDYAGLVAAHAQAVAQLAQELATATR